MDIRAKDYPTISVILCALNEEQNLPRVLKEIPGWVDEVLLIDGHSVDKTAEIASLFSNKIRILYQPAKGKSDALLHGVEQARGEIIVTIDADGATPPGEIEKFVAPLIEGYDLSKGSRLKGKRPTYMSIYRWIGNKILTFTCNVLYGTHFSDICSGYNAFWKDKFVHLDLKPRLKEAGCSMEQQMIVRAIKAGMKVKEIPHSSLGRTSGKSVINGFKRSFKQGIRDWLVVVGELFYKIL